MPYQAKRKGKRNEKPLALHQLPGQVLTDEDIECHHWYEAFPKWPEQHDGDLRGTIQQWSQLAQDALASASRMYEKRMSSSSGDALKRAFTKEKTIGDKIASVTLMVQESPVHRLDELRILLSFTQKKGRRERGPAIEAFKDLLLNDLLPNHRRLIFFQNRQYLCKEGQLSKRHIAYALYESELKSVYREFLQVLEESGKDTLPFFKQKIVKTIYELLAAKPENEKMLLEMLVNKLGDPDRKVSSTASYCLSRLIEKDHPQMRLVVVKEIDRLLTRPNITSRAKYYSVCFLNQIRFTDPDVELARKFVRMYMDIFTVCLEEEKKAGREAKKEVKKEKVKLKRKKTKGKKGDVKSPQEAKETKLMGALLVGVNRAFPYTKPEENESSYEEYYDPLFHVAHAKSLGPSTHALAFLFQVSQSNSTQNDRFYRALYSRIYDITDSSETTQAAFLNLVYKAMKADTSAKRVKAFMKRLLQASCQGTPGFAGACVMVTSEIISTGERGVLKSLVSLTEKDDQDEEFRDVDENASEASFGSNTTETQREGEKDNSTNDVEDSPKPTDANGRDSSTQHTSIPERYDPNKRDPRFAGGDRSSLWEAVSLTSHYHPSVSLFGKTICADMKPVSYPSDPLKDFSQIAFLDRFTYKKAKNRVAKSLYGKRSTRYRDGPLANSEEFIDLMKSGNLAQDDIFLARFFSTNPDRVQRGGIHHSEHRGRDASSDVDSEEEAFQVAMEAEMRRLGGSAAHIATGLESFGGDIDATSKDELEAFEKAFENEMVQSESEGEAGPIDTAQTGKSGVDHVVIDEQEDDSDTSPDVPHVGVETSGSLFADAEDYADAIERDIQRQNEIDKEVHVHKQKRKRKWSEAKSGSLEGGVDTPATSNITKDDTVVEKMEDEMDDLRPSLVKRRRRRKRKTEKNETRKISGQKKAPLAHKLDKERKKV